MRQQWKGFRRLLVGATAVIWLFCSIGILVVPVAQFWIRMSLLFMLVLSTLYALRLLWVAFQNLRALNRRAAELRLMEARSAQTNRAASCPPPSPPT